MLAYFLDNAYPRLHNFQCGDIDLEVIVQVTPVAIHHAMLSVAGPEISQWISTQSAGRFHEMTSTVLNYIICGLFYKRSKHKFS